MKALVIKAGQSNKQYWQDLWRYRELLYFLAWRDILVRYKQTTVGLAWALLRPFISMVVFTVIFSGVAQLPSDGEPYPILVFSAMLPWQFFSSALTDCSNSLINDSNLISKVYFPRLLVPMGSVAVNFVDLLVSGMILLGLMAWYSFIPTWHILLLPVFVVLAIMISIGGGLWFAALNVEYRDFRYVVPFIVQLGFFVSPVGFRSNLVPDQWRLLYSLNPLVGIIDGFRWAILSEADQLYWPGFLLSLGIVLVVLSSGVYYFRATERKFADVI
ncbi:MULTISPECIES: ABC transporter permease [Cyanophyceae]|uniref:ABC transporter permease n=1 Tax=Cyanophyceae TaxID=3028117 RepID=UPI0016837D0B|nr:MULTISPECIES: ABC transporter permease [Cyanophyceae]MBD1918187.1 ABC transporter permease [Phormidium sp. FACHB-77]MBD2030219.1 ABC transporter permease [Phormidium sp. FACHB-322]MBD2051409.1 ABC transporter permease [Leptolyngbya sp. FACHB-60]